VNARGAAPGRTGDAAGSGLSTRDARSIPPELTARLADAGVHSLEDWRRLTRREKRAIFGITRKMAAELDELAAEDLR
jgi:hypothetical protein